MDWERIGVIMLTILLSMTLGLFESVLYIQCMGENRNKNDKYLTAYLIAEGHGKLIFFLHITDKLI